MQYSPKLKRVMAKIKDILIEEDIEGIVILHHQKWSEILNHLETSNSCAKITEKGFEFKLKSSELGKERANEIAENTFSTIVHFSDHAIPLAENYLLAKQLLKSQWNGTEEGGSFTSNTAQQN